MGLCNSKPSPSPTVSGRKDEVVAQHNDQAVAAAIVVNGETPRNRREEVEAGKKSPFFPFYSPSPAHYLFSKKSPTRSPANLSYKNPLRSASLSGPSHLHCLPSISKQCWRDGIAQ